MEVNEVYMLDLIEEKILKENWSAARRLIIRELEKEPYDHWLITRLGLTYYEEKKYSDAFKISSKALALAPHCPLVLWDYAGVLDMLRREAEAISIWKKLIRRGVLGIANDECGEGIRWAKSLLIDCKYRIALAYKNLGNYSLAIRFMNQHLEERVRGTRSIYQKSMVRKELSKIKKMAAKKDLSRNSIRPRESVPKGGKGIIRTNQINSRKQQALSG
jgi:tetratricopeptide (TPR) repeat protein